MTMINNTVRIWAMALVLSEMLMLVGKIKSDFIKKVKKRIKSSSIIAIRNR